MLPLEAYAARCGWRDASLELCPLHPEGGCGFARHGTYFRKVPFELRIRRYYCRAGQTTFGLLPDFLASRWPGTLAEFELAAAQREFDSAVGVAEAMRPAATDERPEGTAVSLAATTRWVARRAAQALVTLKAVGGLLPELSRICGVSLSRWREALRTECVLARLREILAVHLYVLPAPLGLVPRFPAPGARGQRIQQSKWPARPP